MTEEQFQPRGEELNKFVQILAIFLLVSENRRNQYHIGEKFVTFKVFL